MEIDRATIKVLLIEDNPGDARLIMEFLSLSDDERFEVTVAERLDSGMEKLEQESFDLVLLDLTLLDSSGLATFEKISSQSQFIPVIVLTGLDDKTIGVAAVKLGAQEYLSKGEVNQSVLVRTINHSIERASLEWQILQANHNLEERVALRTHELEIERARASRSEKLALIGKLSGGLAHDLRNPLGAIKNATYYLKRKYHYDGSDQADDLSQWIDLIEREATVASNVITNLLSSRSTNKTEFSEVQLHDTIHESLTVFVLEKRIELSVFVDLQLPTIMGDSSQLKRVFQNLVGNAQDAIENHGRLNIDARRQSGSVKIVISDTGIGISPENLEYIFEPLYTNKPYGTGLGLSVCQEIIHNHNGSLTVESTIGSGTAFTILIPTTV